MANPNNLVGLLIGAAVVFLFSGLAINAVSRSAGAVVFEVRRQFREFPGIMDRTQRPEYGKVVDICTRDAQRELITPGLLAVIAPIAVGFGLGVGALAAYLAGAIGTGTLMAVFLANSGGAWDNAKKLVEDGAHGGKGSPAHEATVIGDTVGDPFKDTAGPAINPLIKVMNLVALLIAPAVVAFSTGDGRNTRSGSRSRSVAALIIAPRWSSTSASRSRWSTPRGGEPPRMAPPLRRGHRLTHGSRPARAPSDHLDGPGPPCVRLFVSRGVAYAAPHHTPRPVPQRSWWPSLRRVPRCAAAGGHRRRVGGLGLHASPRGEPRSANSPAARSSR